MKPRVVGHRVLLCVPRVRSSRFIETQALHAFVHLRTGRTGRVLVQFVGVSKILREWFGGVDARKAFLNMQDLKPGSCTCKLRPK